MKNEIKSVCVFCGAAKDVDPAFHQLARDMGAAVAREGWKLVYGGSRTGTMGSLADGALAAGGEVQGFIPSHLQERELQHLGITELRVVGSMHERKKGMVDNADAFVILPGGFGTMDEFFENITWRQIGVHAKPIVIVNYNGFWDPLLALIDNLNKYGFIRPDNMDLFMVVDNIADVPDALRKNADLAFDPMAKWI